ncbi:MAG: hypothetical protein DHS20C18_06990 [Saprospiraceae bacterium]|nr:MAG: hypothetical protein DHS20C18_06990 [Saprospiraceae bacterium]
MGLIISILVNAVAFFVGAQILKGVTIKNFAQAIIVAIVVAFLNFTLGTVLKVVSLGILTLGLFTLLLDAILILVADYFLKGLSVKSFWWALGLAAIVAVVDAILGQVL